MQRQSRDVRTGKRLPRVECLCEFQGDLYAGIMNVDWGPSPEVVGLHAPGEPHPDPVTVDLTLMTDTGQKNPPELQNQDIPGNSRRTFPLHAYVTTYDV